MADEIKAVSSSSMNIENVMRRLIRTELGIAEPSDDDETASLACGTRFGICPSLQCGIRGEPKLTAGQNEE